MLWWLLLQKNFWIWSNPWISMPRWMRVPNGPRPRKWGSGQSRVVTSLREDAQTILASRRSAKVFLARKFILFGLDSRIIGLDYFFKKFFGFGQILEFLCPVECEFRMDHGRVNGDPCRVELWRHFEKTLKQFSASRRSAKVFLARKFILFGLDSRIIGLGDELRLRRLGNQFYRWIRRAFISAASHHDHKKPRTIQAMTMLLTLTSHWLMQNG